MPKVSKPKATQSEDRERYERSLITADTLAKRRGVDVASIRTAVFRANRAAQKAGGVWPKGQIPKPDRYGKGYELGWNPRRKDVQEYLAAGGPMYPELEDPQWLAEQYPARSAPAIADSLGCAKETVYRALDRHGILVEPNPYRPMTLDDVPLSDLEAALAEVGTIVALASRYEVDDETMRRTLRRKRAAQAKQEVSAAE